MSQNTDSMRHRWQNRDVDPNARRVRLLTAIKLAHTAIWVVLGSCVLAIPVAAAVGWFRAAVVLSAIILVECAALALNRGHCPLTSLAAQYTDERTANFDIYLPVWLARHNKTIFGSIFLAGAVFALVRWQLSLR